MASALPPLRQLCSRCGVWFGGKDSVTAEVLKQHQIKSVMHVVPPGREQLEAAAAEAGAKYVFEFMDEAALTPERAVELSGLIGGLERPVYVQCMTGARASSACALLFGREHGWTGADALDQAAKLELPLLKHAFLAKMVAGYFGLTAQAAEDPNLVFRQLFDAAGGSSTYSYLLGDRRTKEAVIIDPVLEQVDRDLVVAEMDGLKLIYAVNTHVHADHITGSGRLKARVEGLRSVISEASGAKSDVKVNPGDRVQFGAYALEVRATPGHTNGCVSYVLRPEQGPAMVFTGDATLIQGCGRTDFQEGSSDTLYDSVHREIFSLDDSTLILPAHEYKGRLCTTVGREKSTNPRLTKSKEEFKQIMADLKLAYPKKIDVALPANLVCGVQD
eukprot:TRINITY_DN56630_c0_g1_i1.p1 TRINITY_DN56630_c0_g1~~TRINITY_DN56630_c0_g1_i1.p1  ORF type:complete len:412 (+),score=139.88 TRINITY_DN56630_c0_g1_i1:72-1238(+)